MQSKSDEIALKSISSCLIIPIFRLSVVFQAWNNTGIIKCYNSEDGRESSIEVEFHDSSVHHPIHINNYLQHTLAALSTKALALACSESEETPSKLVVVRLQGDIHWLFFSECCFALWDAQRTKRHSGKKLDPSYGRFDKKMSHNR